MRGISLSSGAKALVVKAGEEFLLLVLPADRKLDSKKAKTSLGIKALRFATRDEVEQWTGLQPGSIPPFGSLFGLPTCCDLGLALNESINFNAGDHCVSVQMRYADFIAVEKPRIVPVSKQEQEMNDSGCRSVAIQSASVRTSRQPSDTASRRSQLLLSGSTGFGSDFVTSNPAIQSAANPHTVGCQPRASAPRIRRRMIDGVIAWGMGSPQQRPGPTSTIIFGFGKPVSSR